MSVNALLIRWKHGYTQVGETAPPLRMGYLTLGSVETESEAKRIGGQELVRLAGDRTQVSLGADPNAAAVNAYGTGWNVGDYVHTLAASTAQQALTTEVGLALTDENNQPLTVEWSEAVRVMQVSVAEDDNAALTIIPDLSTLLEQQEVRTQRWLTAMVDGTMNGSSAVASPIVTPEWVPGRRPRSSTQTFSWNPAKAARTSPWTPEVAGRLAQMHMRRTGSLVGNTVIAFIVNGVTLDEGTIFDGKEEGVFGGSGVDFRPGDKLELEPTSVAGADNITARVIQTHYH